MLLHPLLEQLGQLRLKGMVHALETQLQQPDITSLSFEERLSLLVQHEITVRENQRLDNRLRNAKLKQAACVENIDYKERRGLDKSLMLKLATGHWIKEHHNLLLTGPTGTGKSYISCALAHKACLENYSARYVRIPRLFQELSVAKHDGRYTKLMTDFAKTDLLILDDWGLAPLTDEQRRDLLELLDDRHHLRSTIVTSQLPISLWHEIIGDNTLADAILDRLVHNAYKINLTGGSMRKKSALICQEEGK
ncbi:MAG TPA: IS21-like element helper ATPase IstB [Gammaproteobacteria bacterium]|nr:IS21-like element helper ATPase IstB [Gammaproteobacteria bacterium]